ncbi:MAG: AMP-binding protein [Chitinophagales bacterium]|nr:AMP-binding protein [Chitinophagales bacterium]
MGSITNHLSFKDYTVLTINGQQMNIQSLQEYCRNSELTILHDLADFMNEWSDDSSQIRLQTSGSTGQPKMITVQKNQMLQSAVATAQYFDFQEGQTALLNLPVKYIAGKMMIVRTLYSRLNLICKFESNSHPIQNLQEDEVIDFAPFVPMQIQNVKDTKSIKKILLGGGTVSRELEESIQNLQAEIFLSYGMTETLSHIAIRKLNGKNSSDKFQTLPNVNIHVDDRDCLVIKVPYIESEVITNDIVEIVSKDQFIWKGRIDNVINSGGVKLHPEQIENQISTLISEAFFVFGKPDNILGEKLCLLIESTPYSKEKLLQLERGLGERLSTYKIPKNIYFTPQFQRTYSGKVKRKESVRYLIP